MVEMKKFEVGLSNGSVLTLEHENDEETTIDDFIDEINNAINNDYIFLKYGSAIIEVSAITYVLELPSDEEVKADV